MHEISGTIFHRWYVTIFGLAFLFFAVRHLGWRKTLVYGVLAFGVGALAENGSTHVGFPYTTYSFNPALRGKEVWVGDVPLFVPLSYTFMGYFAFAAGRLLASGPWRTRARYWWQEFLLAWVLAVWALWVVDFVVGADAIGGSALLMWVPAAAVTAVYWASISPRARRAAAQPSADGDGQVDEAAHEARAQPLGISR